jgi:hypothetical protein
MALVFDDSKITKILSVFPPDKNAEEVVTWLLASNT